MKWLNDLMADVEKTVVEATKQAQQSGTVGVGKVHGTVNNVITQDGDGTYVNGRKVHTGNVDSIDIGNGGVWINGKRVD